MTAAADGTPDGSTPDGSAPEGSTPDRDGVPTANSNPTAGPAILQVTAMTHRGAVRERNEDALVLGGLTACGVDLATPVSCRLPVDVPVAIAVADGVGGYPDGDVAAALVARRLAGAGSALSNADRLAALLSTLSDELLAFGQADHLRSGMGSTVAGLVLRPDGAEWFSVGDSRVYELRSGYLVQLSTDDSRAAQWAEVTVRPAPPTSRITQYLGGSPPDGPVQPHVQPLAIEPGARWLLCTDGLSDLVELSEIERILAHEQDETRAVKALWAAAMNATGRDNISIVLVTAPSIPT